MNVDMKVLMSLDLGGKRFRDSESREVKWAWGGGRGSNRGTKLFEMELWEICMRPRMAK